LYRKVGEREKITEELSVEVLGVRDTTASVKEAREREGQKEGRRVIHFCLR